MTDNAVSSMSTKLQYGDGGVGAGTKASKTVGTSNQQIIARAKVAGTAGNSKTFGIVVSGNNTPFSYSLTANALTITSATDGSGVATTTVDDAIVAIQNEATYRDNWELTTGVGNGSGVLVASASSALSGGAEGTEIFTDVAEVLTTAGPAPVSGLKDVTTLDSPNNTRQFMPTLIDPGELTFSLNLQDTAQQKSILNDFLKNRTKKNWRLVFPSPFVSKIDFAGYVTEFSITGAIEDQLTANCKIKITGFPVWA